MDRKKIFYQDTSAFGGVTFSALVVLLVFLLGYQYLALKLIAGLMGVEILGRLVRIFYRKKRPKKMTYKNGLEEMLEGSFPSIHVARIVVVSFSMGTLLNNPMLWAFFALMVVIVAYGRVKLEMHDHYDALGGAVLGLIVFYALQSIL